ncbi:hypothetical protein TNCV_4169761 [Trichonephila clavipes]|nr:hypothetical protein TNCV_4169761 [Trichonephila clavipes]
MCPKRLYMVCLETVVPVAEESLRDSALGRETILLTKIRRSRAPIPRRMGEKERSMMKIFKYRILPQKARRDDVPQSTSVLTKQSAGGGRGGNAGRKTGRPKAENQFGDNSPQKPE